MPPVGDDRQRRAGEVAGAPRHVAEVVRRLLEGLPCEAPGLERHGDGLWEWNNYFFFFSYYVCEWQSGREKEQMGDVIF